MRIQCLGFFLVTEREMFWWKQADRAHSHFVHFRMLLFHLHVEKNPSPFSPSLDLECEGIANSVCKPGETIAPNSLNLFSAVTGA